MDGAALVLRRQGHHQRGRRPRLLLRWLRRVADEDPHRRALRQGLRLEGQRRRHHRHRPAAERQHSAGRPGHGHRRLAAVEPPVATAPRPSRTTSRSSRWRAPVKATPIRMVESGDTASYAAGTQATRSTGGAVTASHHTRPSPQTAARRLRLSHPLRPACNPTVVRHGFVRGNMVCAGTPAQRQATPVPSAACKGDSGGPARGRGQGRRRGLVGCVDCVKKGAYSVFTKVSTHMSAPSPARRRRQPQRSTSKADLFVRNVLHEAGYEKDSNGTSFGARRPGATGTAQRWSCRPT